MCSNNLSIFCFGDLFIVFNIDSILCRNVGDEWLVTSEDTEMYIPEVSEVKHQFIHLNNYCYIWICFIVIVL